MDKAWSSYYPAPMAEPLDPAQMHDTLEHALLYCNLNKQPEETAEQAVRRICRTDGQPSRTGHKRLIPLQPSRA